MTELIHIFGPRAEGVREAEEAARRSDQRFVRSAGQLASYEPDRRPTGHVLTAWEALDAFGLEVLEEAVEYGAAILKHSRRSAGQALKRRRKRLSLSRASVARAASIPERDVAAAESSEPEAAMGVLNRIALVLGLDERLLAFSAHDPGDELAVRLRTLQNEECGRTKPISPGTALSFAEAASIIRIQHRLQGWLRTETEEASRFEPDGFYGSPAMPAWKVGYQLAESARDVLGLNRAPIPSMRALVEERLGIPVVQAPLPSNREIAGATVATTDGDGGEMRGIVLNTEGANRNVWVRRATLAHELGHLLYDPDERIENLRIDSYAEGATDPQSRNGMDFVEQRANAFAIAFLAPNDAVRETAPLPLSAAAVADTIRTFGIGRIAARYHIYNCHHRTLEIPNAEAETEAEAPSDDWKARENFTVDYFPFSGAKDQRRGRFAYLVGKCRKMGLISEHTAAIYLQCTVEELAAKLDFLIGLYE